MRSRHRKTFTDFIAFFHQKLVADLEGDTHGDFEDLLVALVTPQAAYDCHEIMKAIQVRLHVQLSVS